MRNRFKISRAAWWKKGIKRTCACKKDKKTPIVDWIKITTAAFVLVKTIMEVIREYGVP